MKTVCIVVEPGVCGFRCTVTASGHNRRHVDLAITGSACGQIKRLAELVTELSMVDIFKPPMKNPVYAAATTAGCHSTCPVPLAVLKAAEAGLGLALKRDVQMLFSDECT